MENNTERELSFGERRVQRNFNPSAKQEVEDLKQMYAELLDCFRSFKNRNKQSRNFNRSNRSRNILYVCG